MKDSQEERVNKLLKSVLEKKRGELEEIKVDNPEYDAEWAKIGKEKKEREKGKEKKEEKEGKDKSNKGKQEGKEREKKEDKKKK